MATPTVASVINKLIEREGGYSDNPADRGGKTRWGVTEAVARAHGYMGDMKEIPQETAFNIYLDAFYVGPWFNRVSTISFVIAIELLDCGVNSGPPIAAAFLQRTLNAFNNQAKMYPDVVADGHIGPVTLTALSAFLKLRGLEGEGVLLRAMQCLRGAHYIELAEKNPSQETFVYGWLKNRVAV